MRGDHLKVFLIVGEVSFGEDFVHNGIIYTFGFKS